MKIAVAANKEKISKHFGRSPQFVFVKIVGGKLVKSEVFDNKNHEPKTIVELFEAKGVQRIICEGINDKAIKLFEKSGIQVIAGISGNVEDAINALIKGELIASLKSPCKPGDGKGYGVEKSLCQQQALKYNQKKDGEHNAER